MKTEVSARAWSIIQGVHFVIDYIINMTINATWIVTRNAALNPSDLLSTSQLMLRISIKAGHRTTTFFVVNVVLNIIAVFFFLFVRTSWSCHVTKTLSFGQEIMIVFHVTKAFHVDLNLNAVVMETADEHNQLIVWKWSADPAVTWTELYKWPI